MNAGDPAGDVDRHTVDQWAGDINFTRCASISRKNLRPFVGAPDGQRLRPGSVSATLYCKTWFQRKESLLKRQ